MQEWLIFYACTERATPACYTLDTERKRAARPLLHAVLALYIETLNHSYTLYFG